MKNNISFDILKPEQRKMFALLVGELQSQCVNFNVHQDYNMVTIEI